jgi:hypothetical protein
MAGQARFEQQCDKHDHPARKVHQRGAAFCNNIFVVRRNETEEIHRRMIQQCGGSCMSERKVYQWAERFQEG